MSKCKFRCCIRNKSFDVKMLLTNEQVPDEGDDIITETGCEATAWSKLANCSGLYSVLIWQKNPSLLFFEFYPFSIIFEVPVSYCCEILGF